MARAERVQSPMGSPGGRPGIQHSDGDDRPPLRSTGSRPDPNAGWSTATLTVSGKTAFHVKGLFLLQDVIARPRQLVGQRLRSHHPVGSCLLFLEEGVGFLAEAPGEIGRFDEGPHQIGIAVLGVALALLLAVGSADAVDAAGIGRKVADLSKAGDVARLQQDDDGQHLADARDALEQGVFGAWLGALHKTLLQQGDLRIQRRDNGHVGFHGESDVGAQSECVDVSDR